MSKLTEQNIDKFISTYNKAIDDGAETFFFEGSEVLTKYAKYVIEYANATLNIGNFDGNKFYKSKNKQV